MKIGRTNASVGGGGSIEHDHTLNKNINPDFLHITETEKTNFVNASDFVEDFISNATDILYADLLALINNNELIPSSSYRITDYTTTTTQVDTQSAGHPFDIIVQATSSSTLSEDAKAVKSRRSETCTMGIYVGTYLKTTHVTLSDNVIKLIDIYQLDEETYHWVNTETNLGFALVSASEFTENQDGTITTTVYSLDDLYNPVTISNYFDNANLDAWELKYCIDNDTNRFAWADSVNGKGVIYYMKDEWGNECPYDFKNIQYQIRPGFNYSQWGTNYTFSKDSSLDMIIDDVQYYGYVCDRIPSAWSSNTCWLRDNPATTVSVMYTSSGDVTGSSGNITDIFNENYDAYTFNKTKTTSENFDVSLDGLLYSCYNNIIRPYVTTKNPRCQVLNQIIFIGWYTFTPYPGLYCYDNTFGNDCHHNTFGNYCSFNIFGANCDSNTFGNSCSSNTFGTACQWNTFGDGCSSNAFGNYCHSNTFGNGCSSNTFGDYSTSNTFGDGCSYNTFGDYSTSNTFGTACQWNTFGNSCSSNTFGDYSTSNTFGNSCSSNNFYAWTTGTTKKDYLRYIVLEDGVQYNNFYSNTTTSGNNYLQRIRIKGLEHTTPTDIQITLSEVNTKYEWVICYTSGNILKQYCPDD